jgi:hypothetical protein
VNAIPFGSPAALIAHNNSLSKASTTQDIAIVVCGGGEPLDEYGQILGDCRRLGLTWRTYVGNDMIAHFPDPIDIAVTLHPDKLFMWVNERMALGRERPPRVFSHRPFNNVTDWTRDWQGSTGLFCIKIAREFGHTHIVLCGVPMTIEANHFLRREPWVHATGFQRGWTSHLNELIPYVRSYSGWTLELFGEPDDKWLESPVEDQHRQIIKAGLKA